MDLRWQYEGGETMGSTPIAPGSREYRTRPIPPSERYVVDFRDPIGRVYPFDNGDGLHWCCVTYGKHWEPLTRTVRGLKRAKRYVEDHAFDHRKP